MRFHPRKRSLSSRSPPPSAPQPRPRRPPVPSAAPPPSRTACRDRRAPSPASPPRRRSASAVRAMSSRAVRAPVSRPGSVNWSSTEVTPKRSASPSVPPNVWTWPSMRPGSSVCPRPSMRGSSSGSRSLAPTRRTYPSSTHTSWFRREALAVEQRHVHDREALLRRLLCRGGRVTRDRERRQRADESHDGGKEKPHAFAWRSGSPRS